MPYSTSSQNTLTNTESQNERQLVHPLERNDPVLVDHVDFVTLEFLERATMDFKGRLHSGIDISRY